MKPSEFLSELDGHGIYSASILELLDPEYRECVPQYSHQRTADHIRARGLGGRLAPDDGKKLIYGYSTAAALARQCLDRSPGDRAVGRGSSFRLHRAALKEGGF